MDATTPSQTEPLVRLTENAARHVQTMLAEQPDKTGQTLRVFVEAGGCSGLQYGMVFDTFREGDLRHEFFGVEVLVDAVSADYLRGTVIDYVDALNDGGFKILNPQAKQSCGCGRSFEA